MAKIKATHRLRRPHQVFFDPACHFLPKSEAPVIGTRTKLPMGTHLIPTEGQLAAMPDRFESLSAPEKPAEALVSDEDDSSDEADEADEAESDDAEATTEEEPEDADSDGDPDEPEDEAQVEAHEAVDQALTAVDGEWDALTSAQLEDLADGYEIEASDIDGSGSGGNVLKSDWIEAVQGARGATE